MSGFRTRVVHYCDPYDVGKFDSQKEPYEFEWFGTSDVVEFRRSGKVIAGLSKGDAWLFMKALEHFIEHEEPRTFPPGNPFADPDHSNPPGETI